MDAQIESPLRLRALTLRGIGPYVHGARLDVRPLTILCGENGSGKSTWSGIVDLLRASMQAPCFPFELKPPEDRVIGDYVSSFLSGQLVAEGMRALLDGCTPDDALAAFRSEQSDEEFGDLGTIGIHMQTGRDVSLGELRITAQGTSGGASHGVDILNAEWPKGTALRIRLTHPELSPDRHGRIELAVNGVIRVLFDQRDDRIPKGSYVAYLDREWVRPAASGKPATDNLVPVACVRPRLGSTDIDLIAPKEDSKAATAERLCTEAAAAIHDILISLLSGVFHMSAIRRPFTDEVVKALSLGGARRDEHIRSRSVGVDSAMTLPVYAYYRMHCMVQGTAPFSGFLDGERDLLTEDLPPGEVARLKDSLGLSPEDNVDAYLFERYYAYWIEQLVGSWPFDYNDQRVPGLAWSRAGVSPNGFVVGGGEEGSGSGSSDVRVQHSNNCFHPNDGLPSPLQFSSGFHQIAPMVVQVGLMRRNEVLCIENPEVHLHPKLQTKLCEFFMNQAKCGKCVIMETHSDLFVYRALRAILEEAIPQEWVRIFFTRLEPAAWPHDVEPKEAAGTHSCCCSVMERIRLDDRGRIQNWPQGFMDEDIAEFERLMQALPSEDDEDEGYEEREGPQR